MPEINNPWTPSSWRSKPILQTVTYPESTQHKLEPATSKLRSLPGLVTRQEIDRLRLQLAKVSRGEAFLLQGGDCAELFQYCSPDQIKRRLKLLLLMSLIIIWGTRLPVVRIGRVAGQYAKPRSKSTEIINSVEHLSFRGDIVNGFPLSERTPDPDRLVQAYFHSGATLNHIRSLLASGFADLQRTNTWSFAHVKNSLLQTQFQDIVDRILDALDFMKVVGAAEQGGALDAVDLWTSHEALLLEYEEALTRASPTTQTGSETPIVDDLTSSETASGEEKSYYGLSAHFLWVGDRTRQLDHAHLEYLRGIQNPIGVKVGPTMKANELVELLDLVDPKNEDGRVTLICRYGATKVEENLQGHILAVQKSGHRVVWACDPMHGNTRNAQGLEGVKTRHMADIVTEITLSLKIHAACNSQLNGVHLEMTGDVDDDGFSVTECIGGSMALADSDLAKNYQTYCDPRLNYEQSLDVAFLLANYARKVQQGAQAEDAIGDALKERILR